MAFHLRHSKKSPLSISTKLSSFVAGNGELSLFAAESRSPSDVKVSALRGGGIQRKQVDGSSLPVCFLLNYFTHSSLHRTHRQIPFVLPYPSSHSPLQKSLPLVRHQNFLLPLKRETSLYCLNKIRSFCKDVDSVRPDCEFEGEDEHEPFALDNAKFDIDQKEVERVCKVMDETFAIDRNMEAVLDECGIKVSRELVLAVLQRFNHARKPAFRFFCWAAERPGFCQDSTTYNAMMNILGKTRQFETMMSVLEEMGEKGLLTMETFTICIRVFAAAKERKKAVGIVDLMKKYKFKVGVETINCLLDALGRAKLGKEAQMLFEKLGHRFTPNLSTYTILINGWCRVKNLLEAGRMWNEMIDNGLKPDIVAHNIMLEGLLISKKRSDAIKLFEVMKSKGPLPNARSYTSLIKYLCKHGNMEEAIGYFNDMFDSGCEPDAALYTCLMTGFGNQKKMDMVYRLLKDMKEKGCPLDGRTYNALTNMVTSKLIMQLRTSELGHSLSPLRNSVLSKLTRQNQSNGRLNLPGSDRGLLIVPRQSRRLLRKLLEDVVDEAVHDPHGLARDPDVRVNLLQHLEDVDLVRLHALLGPLLLLVSGHRAAVFGKLLPGLWLLLRRGLLCHAGFLLLHWLFLGGLLICYLGSHFLCWALL